MSEIIHAFVDGVLGSEHVLLLLFIISFAESSFFPLPPDAILIPLALLNPPMAIFYAIITTISSVLGGIFGYIIGDKGGKKIVYKLISEEKLVTVKNYYNKYDVWAIAVAGFTPIPYKIFTVSAGLFDLNFKRFVIASIIGRGGRFITVGILIYIFGPIVKSFLSQYFELVLVAFTVLLVGGFIFMNIILKRKPHSEEPKESKRLRSDKK